MPSASPLVPGRDSLLGLTVRDLDAAAFNRLKLPQATRGVLITRVDPLSAAYDAELERGTVLMEINPFDQFGVELGKDIARSMLGGGARFDASTQALLAEAGIR